MSIYGLIAIGIVLFAIGYVVGVCREKTKWWKIFHCTEPEDFWNEDNMWLTTMDDIQLKTHYIKKLKEYKESLWKNIVIVAIIIFCVVLFIYLIS